MGELKKEFIPYEQSLALKQLGFDEPCFGYFNVTIHLGIGAFTFKESNKDTTDSYGNKVLLRPTFSQAFRWFREKYNLFGEVNIHTYFIYNISNDGFEMIKQYDKLTNTYEEAELACLRKLIEIVKIK